MNKDNRVDAYIEKSQDFAKPILHHIRELVHKACPEVTETIKWGFPCFDYKGVVCSMTAFKKHCGFGFWKASLMKDTHAIFSGEEESAGNIGKITSLKDLPPDKILLSYIRQAVALNEKGIKVVKAKPDAVKKEVIVPDLLQIALSKNKTAKEKFKKFSYSHQKEYVEWINGAKTEETRAKRIAMTVEQLAENKSLNWKYQ